MRRPSHLLLSSLIPLALFGACSEDDTSSGGEGGAASGASSTGPGAGGAAPLVCIEIAKFTPSEEDFPPCDVADQADCLCEGCTDDGICFNAAASLVDDCVCPDCVDDPFCSDPDHCTTDGQCHPYIENCSCEDCAAHPECQ